MEEKEYTKPAYNNMRMLTLRLRNLHSLSRKSLFRKLQNNLIQLMYEGERGFGGKEHEKERARGTRIETRHLNLLHTFFRERTNITTKLPHVEQAIFFMQSSF
jgi:hypothetical protein